MGEPNENMVNITPVDAFVRGHEQWLKKRLYDQRDTLGDVTFVFKNQDEEQDIEIPMPESSQPSDVEMKEDNSESGEFKTLKCHS